MRTDHTGKTWIQLILHGDRVVAAHPHARVVVERLVRHRKAAEMCG